MEEEERAAAAAAVEDWAAMRMREDGVERARERVRLAEAAVAGLVPAVDAVLQCKRDEPPLYVLDTQVGWMWQRSPADAHAAVSALLAAARAEKDAAAIDLQRLLAG